MAIGGIDVGTSGCKVVIFNLKGEILAQAYREYPFVVPQPGWLEINPELIWKAVVEALKEAVASLREPLEAIGVTSHGESLLPLSKEGKALTNVICNFDTRSHHYVEFWKEKLGNWPIYQITGMPLHGMYSANKILWLKDNAPRVFEEAWKFVCVEDYVLFRLTGEGPFIDYSLAGRTMMFDVRRKEWSPEILKLIGIDKSRLSEPVPSGKVVGRLSKSVAEEIGLDRSPLVASGGHDQPCGVLGCAASKAGEAMYGIGTSECVALNLGENPPFDEAMMRNSFCCYPHVVEGHYLTLAYIASGGSLLRWFRDEFGQEEKQIAQKEGKDVYQVLIERIPARPSSLLILPHFAGSGTPYLDEHSRGAILGLTLGSSRFEILRAILESLSFEMRFNVELLEQFGMAVSDFRATGGGARSAVWLQMKADILRKPVFTLETGEAVALGTAILAGLGSGLFKSCEEGAANMVRIKEKILPCPEDVYEKRYRIYQKIYGQLKGINWELSTLEHF
ncbi:FGGY family carbohydrate kinase [Thermatribacter velox]|uniref:FGGY family carbohydrate kinase n=1 Tax=Thermatribacter velox TaxID=3039681 RepID=A0ABZ2YD48_9BACT